MNNDIDKDSRELEGFTLEELQQMPHSGFGGGGAATVSILAYLRRISPKFASNSMIIKATGATNRSSTINTLSKLARDKRIERAPGMNGYYRALQQPVDGADKAAQLDGEGVPAAEPPPY